MIKTEDLLTGWLFAVCLVGHPVRAAPNEEPLPDVLTPAQWQQVDTSVDKALQWLANQQQRNGSFPTLPHGQPGVTSLCVMAFAAHGHLPGEGLYGKQLSKAVDFVLSCQKPSGLMAQVGPGGRKLSRQPGIKGIGGSAAYNHAIGSLVLSEIYAMGGANRASQLQGVIEKSLNVTLTMQKWNKVRKVDQGGWRYIEAEVLSANCANAARQSAKGGLLGGRETS